METYDIPFYAQRKAALIEEINAAFDGVSREGGVSISETRVIEYLGSDEERANARREDNEMRWQDVPAKAMGQGSGYEALNSFDYIGFHYYLPAYLTWYLINTDSTEPEADSNTYSSVDSLLAASYRKGEIEDDYRTRFEMLTLAQSRAVAHFLELRADCEDFYAQAELWAYQETHGPGSQPELISEAEWKQHDQELVGESDLPPDYKAEFARELKEFRDETDSPDNRARYALEKYWGRFL